MIGEESESRLDAETSRADPRSPENAGSVSSAPPVSAADRGADSREPLSTSREDRSLLLIALAIVVVPGLSLLFRGAEVTVERVELEPLLIDVDSAPWYEWMLLEGIGEARARRIAAFVAERRPLASIDELGEIPGMPAGWLDAAREHLRWRPSAAEASSSGGRPSNSESIRP
jgi:hypothetical protein